MILMMGVWSGRLCARRLRARKVRDEASQCDAEEQDAEATAPDENGFRTKAQYMAMTLDKLRALAGSRGLLRRGV